MKGYNMRRHRLSNRVSRKNFRSGSHVRSRNFAVVMRGGYRI